MARYVREPDEIEIWKETVEGVRDGKRLPGTLIVTDRRIVLIVEQVSPFMAIYGAIIAWLVHLAAPPMITHTIERDDFASVESEGKKRIRFHNKGDNYAHISFVVYSKTPIETWLQRVQQWMAGNLSATPIPTATIVDR